VPGSRAKLPPILVENDYVEFLVNAPAAQGKNRVDDPSCLVRFRNRVNTPPKPSTWRDGTDWPPLRRRDSFFIMAGQAIGRPKPDDDHNNLGKKIDHHFFEWSERKDPFEGGMEASVSHVVLRRERDNAPLGVPPEPPPAAISSELAVPLERTAEAVDTILDIMAGSESFYTVPFGVRFVAPSRHVLAPQYGRYTCMIETPLVLPNLKKLGRNYGELRKEMLPETKRMLFALEKALSYDSATSVGARSHWGQYNEVTVDQLRNQYDELDTWLRAYRKFNPFGVFDNAYTRRLKL
jgi:D-arabinono-1,4-lactone oxidase